MDGILGDLHFCIGYADDILMFSSSKEEHTLYILDCLQQEDLIVRHCHHSCTFYSSLNGKQKHRKWGTLQNVSYCNANVVISTAPALTFSVSHAPLLQFTDARNVALGSVIEQVVND
ncbi:uncharacterized protein [Palaemon carinicauda]|uniref:uncharacterized protein n=1 Tax=Palaemon carinicauda TaxID=392227 RepID=UPI0035B62352